MSFSASDAAFEGFRLTRRSPMTLVWWALAYAVFMVLFFVVAGSSMASMMTAAEALEGNTSPTPEDFGAIFASYSTIIGLGVPLGLLFGAVLNAAVVRAVLFPEEKRFGFMRLGGDELRVLLVTFVLSLLAGLVFGIAFMIVFAIGGFGVASESGGTMAAALGVGLALFAVMIWVLVRFSLAVPIVVAEKRIAFFDSWALTKGRFWPLLGMGIIAFVMAMIVNILASIILFGLLAAMGVSGGLTDLLQAEPSVLLATMAPLAITWVLVNAILSAAQVAILYAPFSAAYRGIKGDAVPEAATVVTA